MILFKKNIVKVHENNSEYCQISHLKHWKYIVNCIQKNVNMYANATTAVHMYPHVQI